MVPWISEIIKGLRSKPALAAAIRVSHCCGRQKNEYKMLVTGCCDKYSLGEATSSKGDMTEAFDMPRIMS
jgi:hypothetical protein